MPAGDTAHTYAATSLIGAPGAAMVPPATLGLIGEGSTSAAKLFKNNEDLTELRVAWTNDGLTFSSSGLANGGVISGGQLARRPAMAPRPLRRTSHNPTTNTEPRQLERLRQKRQWNGTAGSSGGTAGRHGRRHEMRWVGSAGTIIINADGSFGLFLSGAWAGDGDSDAFNQIFYTQSSDGENWSIPTSVISTDYTFAASAAQENTTNPLGISAYYEGRAYGASVVQNPDGSFTMLFAGYRLPKKWRTPAPWSAPGGPQWTIGSSDPALYRSILVTTLTSATYPRRWQPPQP